MRKSVFLVAHSKVSFTSRGHFQCGLSLPHQNLSPSLQVAEKPPRPVLEGPDQRAVSARGGGGGAWERPRVDIKGLGYVRKGHRVLKVHQGSTFMPAEAWAGVKGHRHTCPAAPRLSSRKLPPTCLN